MSKQWNNNVLLALTCTAGHHEPFKRYHNDLYTLVQKARSTKTIRAYSERTGDKHHGNMVCVRLSVHKHIKNITTTISFSATMEISTFLLLAETTRLLFPFFFPLCYCVRTGHIITQSRDRDCLWGIRKTMEKTYDASRGFKKTAFPSAPTL